MRRFLFLIHPPTPPTTTCEPSSRLASFRVACLPYALFFKQVDTQAVVAEKDQRLVALEASQSVMADTIEAGERAAADLRHRNDQAVRGSGGWLRCGGGGDG